MRVDVAFLPSLLREPEQTACIVIDVLRATSTLVTLAGCGVPEIVVVPELEQAHALKRAAEADVLRGESPLLCGEVRGLPPEGFDYGNSPEEFSRVEIDGRGVVLFTSNGTRALVHAVSSPVVLVGALLNRTAVVQAALVLASDDLNLTIICSGTDLGTAYCLEDAFCAGALVATCLEMGSPGLQLGDGAQTALRLYESFNGDAKSAFATAEHGGLLQRIGLGADLEFCAGEDRYNVAPRVERRNGQVVVIRA